MLICGPHSSPKQGFPVQKSLQPSVFIQITIFFITVDYIFKRSVRCDFKIWLCLCLFLQCKMKYKVTKVLKPYAGTPSIQVICIIINLIVIYKLSQQINKKVVR